MRFLIMFPSSFHGRRSRKSLILHSDSCMCRGESHLYMWEFWLAMEGKLDQLWGLHKNVDKNCEGSLRGLPLLTPPYMY